ncbi:MAG: DUF503 domain-containing protein [Planctomycetes bacterium]|nr:DUF503 domain-containing protein [Planctomycetota bacterium]
MTVGTLIIQIPLPGIGSLKDKRRIVKSLTERLQSRFNVSIAEIAAQDSHRIAVIGLAVVANEGSFVRRQLDAVLEFLRNDNRVVVGKIDREIFTCDFDMSF